MSAMDGMDGSDSSKYFDFEAYFAAETRGMEELGMQGYTQGAMGAGEGFQHNKDGTPWAPIATDVQPAVSDQQYSYQDTYANIVPNPWAPIATNVQPAVSDQQYSYQDPYPKFISPSECLVDPQDRYGHESPYGENFMGLAPFDGDDNMQGVSSDRADHLGPRQPSVDHSMPSQCADLPSPKPQGKDVDIKNIDEIFGLTPGKSCFCFLCIHKLLSWGGLGQRSNIASLTAISCRIMGCDWRYRAQIDFNKYDLYSVITHEKSHFYDDSFDQARGLIITCKQENCKYSTKRYSDIKRHDAAKHCKNAKKFPCHIIGCKFSGDKGFPRKDKLRDHLKAGHRDMFAPGKPVQTIKPKAGISKAGSNV